VREKGRAAGNRGKKTPEGKGTRNGLSQSVTYTEGAWNFT